MAVESPLLEPSLGKRLSVVVPAFNEEAGVRTTIAALVSDLPDAEIIVVDDASSDGTSKEIAGFASVQLAVHNYNRGQGAALKTGMRLATRTYVAWFDADNEHRAEDLARMVRRIVDEDLVAVIGQRRSPSSSMVRAIGKGLVRVIGRGLRISAGSDLNCGLRVFQRSVICGYLPLIPDRFSASLVSTLIMLERRYPIAFEPVTVNERLGSSTVRLKDGYESILMLLRAVMLFAPMRVFVPSGLLLVGAGLVYGLVVAIVRGSGFPIAGLLLVIAGALSAMLGLVADQVSQLRISLLPERAPSAKEDNTTESDR